MPNEGAMKVNMPSERGHEKGAASAVPAAANNAVQFDVSGMKSAYANVCTVSSTREEVVMAFGLNATWERGQQNTVVQLSNRIILSPFAAKRLAETLSAVLRDYEGRFGALTEGANPRSPV